MVEQEPKKIEDQDEPKPAPIPPTPEKLTDLGAPVDYRFEEGMSQPDEKPPPQVRPALQAHAEETSARRPKSAASPYAHDEEENETENETGNEKRRKTQSSKRRR